MKGCVIKNDYASRFNFLKQAVFKPKLKQDTVSGSVIFKRCNPLAAANTGNNVCALEFPPADSCYNFLSDRRPCVFSIKTLINPCFVNVDKASNRNSSQLFKERLSKTLVNFLVKGSFFYAIFSIVEKLLIWQPLNSQILLLFLLNRHLGAVL